MPSTQERSQELFTKWCNNQVSPSEREEFMQLLENNSVEELSPLMQQVWDRVEQNSHHPYSDDLFSDTITDAILNKYPGRQTPSMVRRLPFLQTSWFRYAAVLLLIAGTASVLFLINKQQQQKQVVVQKKSIAPPDILPGGNKAVLTLADGSTIVLDNAANGSLAQQGGTRIIKLSNGQLAYNQEGSPQGNANNKPASPGEPSRLDRAESYNTISTPKGGQYQIVLPDGTNVWLNAASSIRFPTTFIKDRKVTVTGEVYFNVVKDKTKPFSVQAGEVDIQVLGTGFNINAYSDEAVLKTTLIEGSVQLVPHHKSVAGSAMADKPVLLKPGQQAVVKDHIQVRNDVNTEQVTAWKNGWFSFYKADLPAVMRQLARWYNVEVSYKDTVPSLLFTGKIDRELLLTQVMSNLAGSGVRYTIKDNKITILP